MSEEQRLDGRGYPIPKDGWACFHCGEMFTTWGGARDHFGKTPGDTPGCILKVQLGDERGWLMELRKVEEMAESQMQRALEAEREIEKLECKVSSLTTNFRSFKPFANCDSANEAFFVYDSMEGRALAAEEREKVLVEAVNNAGFAVYLTDDGKTIIKKWKPTSGIPQA